MGSVSEMGQPQGRPTTQLAQKSVSMVCVLCFLYFFSGVSHLCVLSYASVRVLGPFVFGLSCRLLLRGSTVPALEERPSPGARRTGQRDRTNLRHSPQRTCCHQHRLHCVLHVFSSDVPPSTVDTRRTQRKTSQITSSCASACSGSTSELRRRHRRQCSHRQSRGVVFDCPCKCQRN
jgi:hypothetical protein